MPDCMMVKYRIPYDGEWQVGRHLRSLRANDCVMVPAFGAEPRQFVGEAFLGPVAERVGVFKASEWGLSI